MLFRQLCLLVPGLAAYLSLGIRVYIGKLIRQDRNQDGDQEDVAQDSISNQDHWPKYRMERSASCET